MSNEKMIPLSVLRKAYNATSDEDLLKKLAIESNGDAFEFGGKCWSSLFEAANQAHTAREDKPDLPQEDLWSQADIWSGLSSNEVNVSADPKNASIPEKILWVWVFVSLCAGCLIGLIYWPKSDYRYDPTVLDYMISLVWFAAGIFQSLLSAAFATGLGYLRQIANNTAPNKH